VGESVLQAIRAIPSITEARVIRLREVAKPASPVAQG
jgi:hypothetical protein